MIVMAVSKAHQRATNKYIKLHYDRFDCRAPKGTKELIKKAAAAQNESVNQYIHNAIMARIKAENGE